MWTGGHLKAPGTLESSLTKLVIVGQLTLKYRRMIIQIIEDIAVNMGQQKQQNAIQLLKKKSNAGYIGQSFTVQFNKRYTLGVSHNLF